MLFSTVRDAAIRHSFRSASGLEREDGSNHWLQHRKTSRSSLFLTRSLDQERCRRGRRSSAQPTATTASSNSPAAAAARRAYRLHEFKELVSFSLTGMT